MYVYMEVRAESLVGSVENESKTERKLYLCIIKM